MIFNILGNDIKRVIKFKYRYLCGRCDAILKESVQRYRGASRVCRQLETIDTRMSLLWFHLVSFGLIWCHNMQQYNPTLWMAPPSGSPPSRALGDRPDSKCHAASADIHFLFGSANCRYWCHCQILLSRRCDLRPIQAQPARHMMFVCIYMYMCMYIRCINIRRVYA